MKNLTDFCKMVETGVDLHLICLFERHVKVLMCLTLILVDLNFSLGNEQAINRM